MNMTMTPDLVYQLVASNPNLKSIVERTAQLAQIQQQMGPALQQMASNPMAAATGFANWQGQQQPAQPEISTPQPQQDQQGGQTMGWFEQAMAVVEEFRKCFATMNGNLKEIHDMCVSNAEAIKALGEKDAASTARGKAADK